MLNFMKGTVMTGGINWSEFKEGKTSFITDSGSKIVREVTKEVDSENRSIWTVKDSEYVRNKNKKLVPGNIYTNTYDEDGFNISQTIEHDYNNDGKIDAKEIRENLYNSVGKHVRTFVQYDNNNDGKIDSHEEIREAANDNKTKLPQQEKPQISNSEEKKSIKRQKKQVKKEVSKSEADETGKRTIKKVVLENGAEQTTVINENGKVESQKTVNKYGVVTENTNYEYDKNGNCTRMHYEGLTKSESSSNDKYSSYYENGMLKTENYTEKSYYKDGTIKSEGQRQIEKYEDGNMKVLESNKSSYDYNGSLQEKSIYQIEYDNDGYIKSCGLDLTYEGENLKYSVVFSPTGEEDTYMYGLVKKKNMSVTSLEITITDKNGAKRTYNCNSREEILDNFDKFSNEKIWLVASSNDYIPQSTPAMDYTEVIGIKNTILQN